MSATVQTQPRHFLDLLELSTGQLRGILNSAAAIKAARVKGAEASSRPLVGKTLAMIFDRPSTRTRVSFDVGMRELGGESIMLTGAEMQLGRGETIADIAKVAGLSVGLRSRGEAPKRNIDVYIADTLGELGLIYRLAPIVFMGGSLVEHGGQNPIEAIRLGAAVVHGPHVWNFAEIYATLDEANGAKRVADEEALTVQLNAWLANPAARTAIAEAGTASAVGAVINE